ncbi:MAG: SDR family oxidoreductase [Planctomycetota bacterium]|nr:SDR family oxidoreductase [Planctomycetota bacterium]
MSSPSNDWLKLAGTTVLVTGLRNKKSVAWHVGASLRDVGAKPVFTVHSEGRRAEVLKFTGDAPVLVCDVADQDSIDALAARLRAEGTRLDGLVHSIAFAEYTPRADGSPRPFHETRRQDFLRAVDVSCFSLVALADALKDRLAPRASVVAISISTTRLAAESYGYMAPIKAALDSSIAFLAKSFSATSEVRFNTVNPGLLKTSASAGIPGYLENLLFAEAATLRKRGLDTQEAADAVLYLLSPRSSGINAQGLVIDAGMGVNYFDADIVRRATRPEAP